MLLHKEHYRGDRVPELIDAALEARGAISVQLRGQPRLVDFTQFKPRGHYTSSPSLSRYFRAMMWLGRADTGFWLTAGGPALNLDVDPDRELKAAAYLATLVERSGATPAYRDLDALYELFVGKSDNLTVSAMAQAHKRAGGALDKLRAELEQHPDAEQRITSSIPARVKRAIYAV